MYLYLKINTRHHDSLYVCTSIGGTCNNSVGKGSYSCIRERDVDTALVTEKSLKMLLKLNLGIRTESQINKMKSKKNYRSTFPPSSEQVSGSVLYPQSNPLL